MLRAGRLFFAFCWLGGYLAVRKVVVARVLGNDGFWGADNGYDGTCEYVVSADRKVQSVA